MQDVMLQRILWFFGLLLNKSQLIVNVHNYHHSSHFTCFASFVLHHPLLWSHTYFGWISGVLVSFSLKTYISGVMINLTYYTTSWCNASSHPCHNYYRSCLRLVRWDWMIKIYHRQFVVSKCISTLLSSQMLQLAKCNVVKDFCELFFWYNLTSHTLLLKKGQFIKNVHTYNHTSSLSYFAWPLIHAVTLLLVKFLVITLGIHHHFSCHYCRNRKVKSQESWCGSSIKQIHGAMHLLDFLIHSSRYHSQSSF